MKRGVKLIEKKDLHLNTKKEIIVRYNLPGVRNNVVFS